MPGSAVNEVVTVDRRDHDMAQRQLCHCRANIFRLMRIKKVRPARCHVAEGAGTGADRS